MKKQTFKLHSTGNFSSYLKRFSMIEKSLLLEIVDGKFIAKTHTPDKAVVKISSTVISEILDDAEKADPVKIGMFAVDNFIQTFKHLSENDVKFEVTSESVAGDETATQIKIYDKNLKFNFGNASPSMFKYIDKALISRITDSSSSIFSFRVDKDLMGKVSSLCSIDSGNDLLTIKAVDKSIFFEGKSFSLNLPGVIAQNDATISFYKTHFAFIDKEDTEIFILPGKAIFKSLESDTTIVIGMVE